MKGYFGEFGGQYVPETLLSALDELDAAMAEAFAGKGFWDEFNSYMVHYVGRPTPLTHARRLSEHLGIDVWLKREDLNHTGSHKINNAIGQILLPGVWESAGS
jgi:tryptophan synthase beta chain